MPYPILVTFCRLGRFFNFSQTGVHLNFSIDFYKSGANWQFQIVKNESKTKKLHSGHWYSIKERRHLIVCTWSLDGITYRRRQSKTCILSLNINQYYANIRFCLHFVSTSTCFTSGWAKRLAIFHGGCELFICHILTVWCHCTYWKIQ